MADAPEALTYAELVQAQIGVDHYVRWLGEGLVPGGELAKLVANYKAVSAKLGSHANYLLNTGDVAAQRAELYR